MTSVNIGQDDTFNNADDGEKGSVGLGIIPDGIGSRSYDYDVSNNRVMAASYAAFAGSFGCWAETWTNVNVQNPQPGLGEWSQHAKITMKGFWSAFLEATVSGTEVRLEAFIRDNSGDIDSKEILHKTSDIVNLWSNNESYSVDLYGELETSSFYEVGIRVKVSAKALSQYSTGIADCYAENNNFSYDGRYEYDSIELTWL